MPQKKKIYLGEKLRKAMMELSSSIDETKSKVPDIITFCESPYYLNIQTLYPVQKLILKIFYRGSIGNEDLKLNEEEIQLLKDLGLNDNDRGDVLGKYESGELFKELVLVWGRRSGKDWIASVIAAYEACRLLEIEGGDPYAYYAISSANPITILTVATAAEQAEIAYSEITAKILQSDYFKDKYIPEGVCSDRIFLLTPQDKKENLSFMERKLPLKKGSVAIVAGHSNSASLLGKGIFVVIFDEVASYPMGGVSSGERLYSGIRPALTTYGRWETYTDENGEEKKRRIFDGKVISISSPRGKEGILYDLFTNASKFKKRLVCRLPTWFVNPNSLEADLREEFPMSEEDFAMEFGAEFSGTSTSSMFIREIVESAFTTELKHREFGEPGKVYFAHIDPATTSNNYALVVVHKEFFFNEETKMIDYRIIVDHIKYWHPTKNKPVNPDIVDEYLLQLKKKFYLAIVTYDQMNDLRSIMKLQQNSIPHKLTRYNNRYKMLIYTNLDTLMKTKRILIPEHQLLKRELINLQKKPLERTFRIMPKGFGDIRSDDISDALAGATFMCIQHESNQLPTGRVINMSPSSNNGGMGGTQQFRSMQGTPYTINPNTREPFPFASPYLPKNNRRN